MKKTLLLIASTLLIPGSIFWGCQKDELFSSPLGEQANIPVEILNHEELLLKNGSISFNPICDPQLFSLLNKVGRKRGMMWISNNEEFLYAKFEASESLTISEVNLWVGVDPCSVPMNKNKVPLPGRFPYKTIETDNHEFTVKLTDLCHDNTIPGSSKTLIVFAHVTTRDNFTGEYESSWSNGESFDISRWGSYSEYRCCGSTGGGGCFLHKAFSGDPIGDNYLFTTGGGKQNIYTENQDIAGFVEFYDNKIVFRFDQDWMFTDLAYPAVAIFGLNHPGSDPVKLFSGEPEKNPPEEPFYLPFEYDYNFYIVELNVQYCTTE